MMKYFCEGTMPTGVKFGGGAITERAGDMVRIAEAVLTAGGELTRFVCLDVLWDKYRATCLLCEAQHEDKKRKPVEAWALKHVCEGVEQ